MHKIYRKKMSRLTKDLMHFLCLFIISEPPVFVSKTEEVIKINEMKDRKNVLRQKNKEEKEIENREWNKKN